MLLGHEQREVRSEAHFLAGSASQSTGQLVQAVRHLTAAASEGSERLALQANLRLCRVLRGLGRYDDAMASAQKAYELAEAADDDPAMLESMNLQASIINAKGEHQRALDMLHRAKRRALAAGEDSRQLATIGTNIGEIHRLLGDHPQALEHLKDAYDRFKEANVQTRASNSNLISLGILYRRMGKNDEAERFYEEARRSAIDTGDLQVHAAALNNLAGIALTSGNLPRADRMYGEALAMAEQAGDLQYQSDNLDGLGKVHIARNEMHEASAVLSQARDIARSIGYRDGELQASLNLARAQLSTSNAQDAVNTLGPTLELADGIGDLELVFTSHELLSQAHEALGDYRAALWHSRRFHEVESTVYNEQNEEQTRQLTVKFELERSRHQADMYRMKSGYLQQARDQAEAQILSRTRELEEAQLEIVTRLAVAAEYRDDDTGTHTRRVGRNAAAIGFVMGFPEQDLQVLFTAARLHDVGKIGIPDAVLLKSGRLNADEMELMRRHTDIGARILSAGGSRLLHLAESISLSHHERWDGKGYPHGLSGEAIPMAARIVAVSDVLDALTHARPYKPAWPVHEALAELESQSGRQFDPDAVSACLAVFRGEGGLSPLEDSADWPTLLSTLKALGAERGFPVSRRGSVW